MTTHNIKFSSSRQLGKNGPTVTSPAPGGMSLSGAYGAVDDEEGVRVIHAYLGVSGTLIDAAVPVGAARGDRYPTQFMGQLDSER